MIPQSTVSLLKQWALWGAMQNIGYPKMSPMFGERALKTPLFGAGYCSPEVQQIERAVCRLEPGDRQLLIHKYQWHMRPMQIAEWHRLSRSTLWRRMDQAEWAVHIEFSRG